MCTRLSIFTSSPISVAPYEPPFDRRVAANFHVAADNATAHLRNFPVRALAPAVTIPVRADAGSAVDDAAVPNANARVHCDARVQDDLLSQHAVGPDHRMGAHTRSCAHCDILTKH